MRKSAVLVAAMLLAGPALAQMSTPAATNVEKPAPATAEDQLNALWVQWGNVADQLAVEGTQNIRLRAQVQAAFAAFIKEQQDKVAAEAAKATAAEKRATAAEARTAELQRELAQRPQQPSYSQQPYSAPPPKPQPPTPAQGVIRGQGGGR
jgi:hypothetical protein